MKPKRKPEREKQIADFVRSLWQRGVHDTQPDRDRWSINLDLFAGKQNFKQKSPWQSDVFIHMFAPLCRRMADGASDILFDKENFIELEAFDESNQGQVRLAQIFSKVLTHYNDKARIQTLLYEFLLAAGACGLGIVKVYPEYRTVYSGEVIVEKVRKQQEKTQKKIAGKVENPLMTIPEGEQDLEELITEAFDEMFDDEGPSTRKIGPKKRYDLFIRTEVVNPLNHVTEPDCDNIQEAPYDIQRHFIKLHELAPHFESGFLDKSKREYLTGKNPTGSSVGGSLNDSEEGQKINLRDQYTEHSKYARSVELLEYYGDWWDEDGTILEERKHFIVANGNQLLRDADIDSWSQTSPYLKVVISPRPFKAYGAGVADAATDQQLLTNEFFSQFVDMMRLAIYPPYCFDSTAIKDSELLEEQGISPGQLIASFKPASEAFSTVPFPGANVAPILFQMFEMMNLTGEKGAGVDVQSANPASRARISAKEIQSNVNRSGQSQNSLARNLDENLLEPYAKTIYEILLQHALEKENLRQLAEEGVITQEEFSLLSDIPQIERYLEAKKKVKVKIRGFRERIERINRLGSSSDFLMSLASFPPEVLQKINFTEAMKDIVELYGFDADRWVIQNNPTDKAREENALLQNNQFVTAAPNDQHNLELPAHYEAVLSGLTPALQQHIQEHLDSLLAAGLPVPMMPPAVQEALGLNEEAPAPQPSRRTIRAKRNEDGTLEGEVIEAPQGNPQIQ